MKSVTPRLQLVEPDAPQGSERPPRPHLPALKKPVEYRGEIMDSGARTAFEQTHGDYLERFNARS